MQLKSIVKYSIIGFLGIANSIILPNFLNDNFSKLPLVMAKEVTFPMLPLESTIYFATQRHRHNYGLPGLNNSTELSRIARDHSKLILENSMSSTKQSQPEFENLEQKYQKIAIVEGWIDCEQNDNNISTEWIAYKSQQLLVKDFNGIGVGIMRNNSYQCYITQIFVKS